MKKLITTSLIALLNCVLLAQEVKIIPDLEVDSTFLTFAEEGAEHDSYSSFDNKNPTDLAVFIGEFGVNKITVKIYFGDTINTSLNRWYKPPMFNEENIADIKFENFKLELNQNSFKLGDIVMGRIEGTSTPIYLATGGEYRIKVEGEFRHIIGKVMTKRTAKGRYNIRD
jgi:hypothetical protein